MNKEQVIPESVQHLIEGAGSTDLVLGVMTFNNRGTIAELGQSLTAGLRQYYPGASGILVNCDAGSQDGTPELLARAAEGSIATWLVQNPLPSTYSKVYSDSGVPAKENAVRQLFAITEQLQAKACLLLDGNLKSLTPEWVDLLAGPIFEKGFDCVFPMYRRNRYEGTLTNAILYPLTRALYGKRIRFHLGGGYGMSGKFASFCLSQPAWDGDIVRFGVDHWLTTVAVAEGFEVCQSFLGPRLLDLKPGGADLSAMLAQSVGCVFQLMERYSAVWEAAKGSSPVTSFGPPYESGREPGAPKIERMVNAFQQGLRDLLPVWEIILAPDTLEQVLSLGLVEASDFRFPADLWVQTVYDFALAYHDGVLHREHLLKALTPLYLGYTASLVLTTKDYSEEHVERAIEGLCSRYEAMKPYLTQRWRFQ